VTLVCAANLRQCPSPAAHGLIVIRTDPQQALKTVPCNSGLSFQLMARQSPGFCIQIAATFGAMSPSNKRHDTGYQPMATSSSQLRWRFLAPRDGLNDLRLTLTQLMRESAPPT